MMQAQAHKITLILADLSKSITSHKRLSNIGKIWDMDCVDDLMMLRSEIMGSYENSK